MIFCHSQIEAVGDLTQSLPLPLRGRGGVSPVLDWLGWPCPFTTGARWPNRAGASVVFVSLPRPLTGHKSPYRAEFGLPVFVCPRCAHRHILASVFQDPFWEALFFVTSTANVEVAPTPILGKQKAGISSSLCIKIQFSTTFWSNRIRIRPVCHPPLPAWRYHQS